MQQVCLKQDCREEWELFQEVNLYWDKTDILDRIRVCVCVTANVGGGLITDACGIPINVLNWTMGSPEDAIYVLALLSGSGGTCLKTLYYGTVQQEKNLQRRHKWVGNQEGRVSWMLRGHWLFLGWLIHCTWWPINVRGCPVSIQSSSGAGGRSKHEGHCEVEAIWLKKTNRSQAGKRDPWAKRIAKIRFVFIFQPKSYWTL